MLSVNDRKWIEKHFEGLRELIAANQVDIAVLKTKSGLYGLLGGLLGSIGVGLMYIFLK